MEAEGRITLGPIAVGRVPLLRYGMKMQERDISRPSTKATESPEGGPPAFDHLWLDRVVDQVAERGGGGEGWFAAPAWNVEGAVGVSVGERALLGVLAAQSLLDEAAALEQAGVGGEFLEDEKALAADGAADFAGESGLMRDEMHEKTCFPLVRDSAGPGSEGAPSISTDGTD